MHLIDVTNSYSTLVHNQLNSTDTTYVKVYSLGNTSVVYSESSDSIEIVLENHHRKVREDEIEFTLNRLVQEDKSWDILADKQRHLVACTCRK